MSKSSEKLSKIAELLGLSTKEEVVEQEVVLAEDEVKEVKEAPKQEVATPDYATKLELNEMKQQFLEMFKALLEENEKGLKEVPQELAKQEVELEEVKEIVHSPENEVEKKATLSMAELSGMSITERIYAKLNQ